jgi:biotin carboxyl carrier protein
VEFEFMLDNRLRKISLEKKEGLYRFKEGEESFEADIQTITPNIISIRVGSATHRIYLTKDTGKRYVQVEGQEFVLHEPSQDEEGFDAAEGKSQEDILVVKTPMPGKVIKINVKESDEVRKNQTLAVVEAMKMENEIKSSIDGFVKKIHCKPGDLVETENPLIELSLPE